MIYAWLLCLASKQLTLLDVAGLYVAIENHFDPHSLLIKYGLLSGTALHAPVLLMLSTSKPQYLRPFTWHPADKEVEDDKDVSQRGWFTNLLSGPSSSIALAFLCNKALLPVRAPLTIGLTPMVARYAIHALSDTGQLEDIC